MRLILSVLIGMALSVSARPAFAGVKSFSVNLYGMKLTGATATSGSFGFGGVSLPGGSQSDFSFSFVVPNDYVPNTPIRIRISFHTADTGCNLALLPNFVDRTRVGHSPATGSASGGLDPANGSTLVTVPAVANEGARKNFQLTANQGFADQLPGDAILLGFFRRPGSFGDNCPSDVKITGIDVRYDTP
jgi:hypothetical protein